MMVALAVLVTTSACARKDTVLAGKREGIWSGYDGGEVETGPQPNRAQPIRLAAAQSNANWLQSPVSEFARTPNPALRATPQLAWSVSIGAGDGNRARITADPVVAGGRIFAMDSRARVSAVSTDGKKLWEVDLTPPHESASDASGGGLAYGNNLLYVTSSFGILTALTPGEGKIAWQQKLGSTSSGAPTVYEGIVYAVSGDDTGWALDATTGRILWQLTSSADANNVMGAAPPAISRKYAVFSFGPGELQGAFRQGGLRMWDSQIAGQRRGISAALVTDITGAPVIAGDRVYVGTHSGRTVALNIADGERIWTAEEGALSQVWPAGGSVFLVSDKNELLRLSAETGERIWGVRLPLFTKVKPRKQAEIYTHHGPLIAGGQLVVASSDGLLRFFDPVSGGLRHYVDVPGGATTDPVVANGTLYVVSTKGQLLAYR